MEVVLVVNSEFLVETKEGVDRMEWYELKCLLSACNCNYAKYTCGILDRRILIPIIIIPTVQVKYLSRACAFT